MCELLALSCSRKARMTFALGVLAAHGAASGRTRDGWGAAFYDDNDVALFASPPQRVTVRSSAFSRRARPPRGL